MHIFSFIGKNSCIEENASFLSGIHSFIRKETPLTVFSEFSQLHFEEVWEEYVFSVGRFIYTHVYPTASMPQKGTEWYVND